MKALIDSEIPLNMMRAKAYKKISTPQLTPQENPDYTITPNGVTH